MPDTDRPTGVIKVAYDHPDTIAQVIRDFADHDPDELVDLALNLLHDVEECKRVIVACYERLDALTAVEEASTR